MKTQQRRDSPPPAEVTVATISTMSSDAMRAWLHSPEDHGAVLPVEGKVVDRNGTSTPVNGRRQPVNTAVWRHQGIAVEGNLELAVHTIAAKIQVSSTVVPKNQKKNVVLPATHLFSSMISGSQMILEGMRRDLVMFPYRADLGGWSQRSR